MLSEFIKYLSSLPGAKIQKQEGDKITFEYNDLTFLFIIDSRDPSYVRLVLPGIASVDDIEGHENLCDILNDYNVKYKAAKMIRIERLIHLSFEQFLYSKEGASELFARMISILVSVFKDFRSKKI